MKEKWMSRWSNIGENLAIFLERKTETDVYDVGIYPTPSPQARCRPVREASNTLTLSLVEGWDYP